MILVVGAGSIGKRHLANLVTLGVQELAVADPRKDRLQEALDRVRSLQVAQATKLTPLSSHQEALDQRLPIKAVVIATPPRYHPEAIGNALEMGCPILCEKPLACDDGEWGSLAELIGQVEKAGLFSMVAYNYRFNAQLQTLRQMIQEDVVGRVLSVRGTFSENLREWHPWEGLNFYMASQQQGGGALLDESHLIDLCRWLFGEIAQVSGYNTTLSSLKEEPGFDTDDLVEILVRFESGAIGSLHMDLFGRHHQKRLEIIGEEGTLFWNFDNTDLESNGIELWKGRRLALTPETARRVPEKRIPSDGRTRNQMYLDEMRYFLQCCKLQRHFRDDVPDLKDGLRTLSVVRAARQSNCAGARGAASTGGSHLPQESLRPNG